MAALLYDASAIVKRYASEVGSAWVVDATDTASGNTIFVARITEVEVVSAITRRVREGVLKEPDGSVWIARVRNDFIHHYRVVEITPPLIVGAVYLVQAYGLRAYDAVQLAAALEVNLDRILLTLPAVTMISVDRALNTAALAEGLAVDDPNNHP